MWIGAGVSILAGLWSLKLLKMSRADARKMREAMLGGHVRRATHALPSPRMPVEAVSRDLATSDDYSRA
jgi:hypothetical protein